MKSRLLILTALTFWHGTAMAGFQWIPSSPNPSAQKPAAKTKEDFLKRNRTQQNHKETLSPAQKLDRIYDYEAQRITSMEEQQALQDKAAAQKARKNEFVKSKTDSLNETIVKNKGIIPFKGGPAVQATTLTPQKASVPAKAQAPAMPTGEPLADMSIDPTQKPIVGFGTDVPLALAVSDVVPDHYSFSFDPKVNPGTSVSWEGLYRPWHIVLSEMLAMRNLSAVIDGKQIKVFRDPTKADTNPVMLPGMSYASGDRSYTQRGININPMPDPKKVKFDPSSPLSLTSQMHNSAPPMTPLPAAQEDVKATPFLPRPPSMQAPSKPALQISSFPLKDSQAKKPAKEMPFKTRMTPIYQDSNSLMISGYPLKKSKDNVETATAPTHADESYISRQRSHEIAEEKKGFSPFKALGDLFSSRSQKPKNSRTAGDS